MAVPLPIIDPHFHVRNTHTTHAFLAGWTYHLNQPPTYNTTTHTAQVWNTHAHPNPTLGELGDRLPVYSLLDYERDAGVGLAGYVHIETVGACCVRFSFSVACVDNGRVQSTDY